MDSFKMFFLGILTFGFSQAFAEVKSVYTDIDKDCIEISSSTEKAPIDFYDSECKAFGGYKLTFGGGDVRYHVELSYSGVELDMQTPLSFHDLGSKKVEWVYDLTQDDEGSGELTWKALIYRINSSDYDNDGEIKNVSTLYVMRLKGIDSCVVAKVKTNEEARKAAENDSLECLVPNYDD